MPGGLLQLSAYGSQDFYLTGNPQISFFKTVYRRYTNFSMEFYTLNPENNIGLSETEIVTYNFDIKRNGDLINDIYFVFTLPDIYSDINRQFKWVKNIGFNIINKVTIFIGGSKIDEHYGEWFNIWNELSNTNKNENFDYMVGNSIDFHDPANAPGNNGLYPQKNKNSDTIPSIQGRKIYVPLIFWFNRNPSLALPLISLQYHPVQINIEIKKISDLFTIIDINKNSTSYGTRIKPLTTIDSYSRFYSLQNFVNDDSISTGEGINTFLKNFTIDPLLRVNYIFLGENEMRKFAQSEHKYLIDQVKLSSYEGIIGSKTLDLKIQHPTSFFVVVGKRDDVDNRNDWNNYTNWIDEETPPFRSGFNNEFFEEFKNDTNASEKGTDSNYSFKKSPYILKNLQLKLNGTDRFSAEDSDFLNNVVSNSFAKQNPKKGILFYSFSLNPFDYQPSGTCNMSRFNTIELFIETQDVPIPTTSSDNVFKYDINVYTVNYNILRITSGTGNLEFSN